MGRRDGQPRGPSARVLAQVVKQQPHIPGAGGARLAGHRAGHAAPESGTLEPGRWARCQWHLIQRKHSMSFLDMPP